LRYTTPVTHAARQKPPTGRSNYEEQDDHANNESGVSRSDASKEVTTPVVTVVARPEAEQGFHPETKGSRTITPRWRPQQGERRPKTLPPVHQERPGKGLRPEQRSQPPVIVARLALLLQSHPPRRRPCHKRSPAAIKVSPHCRCPHLPTMRRADKHKPLPPNAVAVTRPSGSRMPTTGTVADEAVTAMASYLAPQRRRPPHHHGATLGVQQRHHGTAKPTRGARCSPEATVGGRCAPMDAAMHNCRLPKDAAHSQRPLPTHRRGATPEAAAGGTRRRVRRRRSHHSRPNHH
jgi:hypothetical protein